MGRRGQECRCCAGCSDCDTTPTVLKAHIVYPEPEGGSEIIEAGEIANGDIFWSSVSTSCTAAGNVGVFIFITNPGQGYTSPPTMTVTPDGSTAGTSEITIQSTVNSVSVTNGGTGYSTSPSVKFSGGKQLTAPSAFARVEGTLSTLTLTSPGIDYSSPPTVTFATGTGATASVVMNGYVSALQLTDPGSEYTTAPSVTISGGGGSGATATAFMNKAAATVSGVVLTNKGSGYASAPAVTITGGGGKDAAATGSILFTVQSISLVAGGSGYPPNPEVTLTGGGGSNATATAKISGSVVGVDVSKAGLYEFTRLGNNPPGVGPTITFSGGGGSGAAGTPILSGKVVAAASSGFGYAATPTIAFSGGGGSGATAVSDLAWARQHTRRTKISPINCSASINIADLGKLGLVGVFSQPSLLAACLDAQSEEFPPAIPDSCPGLAEQIGWNCSVNTDASQLSFDGQAPLASTFAGEAIRANVFRQWAVPGSGTENFEGIMELVATICKQRFFSRVDPIVTYRIKSPAQVAGNNVAIQPTFTQYVDVYGESYWYLESLAITNAGQNLRIPPGTTACDLEADGNSRNILSQVKITVTRSSPVVAAPVLDGFSVQPSIAFTVVPVGAGGFHFISEFALTSGGTTGKEDGTVLIDLVLTAGHFTGPHQLRGTIGGGTLTSLVLVISNLIIGPSKLASVNILSVQNRELTGESRFTTTRFHSQPTVTATQNLFTEEGQVAVTLGVILEQATDLNGETYWYVDGITGEFGDDNLYQIVVEVAAPGMQQFPAIASLGFFNDEQVLSVRMISGGKYYVRETTATSQPLPPISCIGEISTANGWEINNQQYLLSSDKLFAVDQPFTQILAHDQLEPVGLNRTRRCGLPTITLELE